MIKSLLFVSIAPIIIVALYVYIRDKYEKEPIGTLIKALLSGVIIIFPIVIIEEFLLQYKPPDNSFSTALYTGFVVAGLTEEGFKFAVFFIFFWNSRDFNERFDGIVYAVFISLGFAAVENIIYVYRGGYDVGMLRALTAVPAHALFGTVMGFHLGNAKFYISNRWIHLLKAFLMPVWWHGLYDFLIMSRSPVFLLIFIPVLICLWINGFMKMKELSSTSVFRNDFPHKDKNGEDLSSG
jgi:RsiW-degrading membrane proteinase PrsW (M82 family)